MENRNFLGTEPVGKLFRKLAMPAVVAQIINLLKELQEKRKLTYLFISHDLSVVKYISNRIVVMYLGKVMEISESRELFHHPAHPYTQALLSAVPSPTYGTHKDRILLKGDVPSPVNPKPGCRFAQRCQYAKECCFQQEPELKEIAPGHLVACHMV